jgi:hypothetical protein
MSMKKSLIFLHRWIGVALCLIFLMWFASGIVMMYYRYPGVTPAERLNHQPDLDPFTDKAFIERGIRPIGNEAACR